MNVKFETNQSKTLKYERQIINTISIYISTDFPFT